MSNPRRDSRASLGPEAAAGGIPAWAAMCFFVSGAAGLLYEVVWSKELAYLLGTSLHAVATVVAAFLAGLAIGARLLGAPLASRGNGARVYAALELGVAVLGVLSLPVLRGLDPIVGQLYRGLGGEGPSFAAARAALLFVLMLPPAALMGATLPVLVAHAERGLVGPALARLYALNTLGAVAGSALGGFVLLPGLGLTVTTWVAAGLNVAAALLAWIAGGAARASAASPAGKERSSAGASVVAADAPVAGAALQGPMRTLVACLFALSGFAALVFQIAWVRLFGLVFGSSVYSFSAVLGVYLLGLALGSAAIARLVRRVHSLRAFGAIQVALALAAALMLPAFSRLPDWLYALAERSGADWGALFGGELLILATMLLVPCALLGAAFPIAARLLQTRDGGHATGFAYAVNTCGTIAGSLVAGFVLVPRLGVQQTHVVALVLSLVVGLVALALARKTEGPRRNELLAAGAAIVAIAALVMFAPRWDASLMSAGAFRPTQAARLAGYASASKGPGTLVQRASRVGDVLFYREGLNGSVLVGADRATGKTRWLTVGGKVDASTDDMETQVLLGLVPAALADSGARTLVIGLGSGFTVASVLAGGAGATDVVELEPAVVEASRFFFERGAGPLDDPRVRLVVGDARTHLLHGAGTYGLIVSEPSNPWIAGVGNLFTQDFYRRVRTRLSPDGVFCQWLQLYELSPATFETLVATFLDVFPEGNVFAVWRALDVLLIAAPQGRALAFDRLGSEPARVMLARAGIRSPESIAAYYAGPLSALRGASSGALRNTDDRPVVEYRAPRDLIEVGRASLQGEPRVIARVPFAGALPAESPFTGWSAERWFTARAQRLGEMGQTRRASEVVNAAREAGQETLADHLALEIDRADRHTRGMAQVEQANAYLVAGMRDEGRQALEQAAKIDPENHRTWLMLSDLRRAAGDLDGAEQALARGSGSAEPSERADAAMIGGLLEVSRNRPQAAIDRFVEAQGLMPALAKSYLLESKVQAAIGNVESARRALERGLVACPADPELTAALGSLPPAR